MLTSKKIIASKRLSSKGPLWLLFSVQKSGARGTFCPSRDAARAAARAGARGVESKVFRLDRPVGPVRYIIVGHSSATGFAGFRACLKLWLRVWENHLLLVADDKGGFRPMRIGEVMQEAGPQPNPARAVEHGEVEFPDGSKFRGNFAECLQVILAFSTTSTATSTAKT